MLNRQPAEEAYFQNKTRPARGGEALELSVRRGKRSDRSASLAARENTSKIQAGNRASHQVRYRCGTAPDFP